MTRRGILKGIVAGGLWNLLPGSSGAAAPVKDMKGIEELQKNWTALLAPGMKVPTPSELLKLSKEEWRKRLDKAQFHVLREEGTERAGTSPLNREKRDGIFACAGCDLPVFTSAMKYESGARGFSSGSFLATSRASAIRPANERNVAFQRSRECPGLRRSAQARAFS